MDEPEDQSLPPSEAERARRRDHDATAARRKLMRTGQAKVFNQILERQARVSREIRSRDEPKDGPKRT